MKLPSIWLLLTLAIGGCGVGASQPVVQAQSSVSQSLRPQTTGVIKNIVVIVQENRTPDNLFNGFPNADTKKVGLNHLGQNVSLAQVPLFQAYDLDHSTKGFMREYDGGKMDGFDLEYNDKHDPLLAYQYTIESDVDPYWQMAKAYTFGDRMFASTNGPSFGTHQYLIAGQAGLTTDNPHGHPWGCDLSPTFCYDYQTLGDTMDNAQVSWRYYAAGAFSRNPKNFNVWLAYDAIRHIRYGPDWSADMADTNQFFTDVSQGNLKQYSEIVPTGANSDHAGTKLGGKTVDTGPAWVASIVDAIGQSKYWNNTAIIVVWDDWGGWYDHVPPQQLYPDGLGIRVPLIVISPYARRGYVSHVNHEFGSILHFTETTFGLPSLGKADARSDDLSDCFDFTQSPGPFHPFVHGRYTINDSTPPDNE